MTLLNDSTPDSSQSSNAGGAQPGGVVPRAEALKAFRERDKTKAGLRAIASAIGLEPDDIRIIETGDPKNPFQLDAPGLEDLASDISESRRAKLESQRQSGKWADREAELTRRHQSQLQKLTKENAAFDAWIQKQSINEQLIAACRDEGAYDDGSGQYSDLTQLLGKRLKAEKMIDPQTGELSVDVAALDENGIPMKIDGKPATPRQLVSQFLQTRPHFKRGASARGQAAARSRGAGSMQGGAVSGDRGLEAARKVFGDSFVPKQ